MCVCEGGGAKILFLWKTRKSFIGYAVGCNTALHKCIIHLYTVNIHDIVCRYNGPGILHVCAVYIVLFRQFLQL